MSDECFVGDGLLCLSTIGTVTPEASSVGGSCSTLEDPFLCGGAGFCLSCLEGSLLWSLRYGAYGWGVSLLVSCERGLLLRVSCERGVSLRVSFRVPVTVHFPAAENSSFGRRSVVVGVVVLRDAIDVPGDENNSIDVVLAEDAALDCVICLHSLVRISDGFSLSMR